MEDITVYHFVFTGIGFVVGLMIGYMFRNRN